MQKKIIFYSILIFSLFAANKTLALPLQDLKLPPGFTINIYADNVPGARSMALGKNGTVFVGTKDTGKVYALVKDKNSQQTKVFVIAKDLNMPNGVAYKNGSLYVAEPSRVLRYDQIEDHLQNPPSPIVINDNLPSNKHHGWRYIAFGPDGWLYIAVGAPCNACVKNDPRFATIMRMQPDGSNLQIYAKGIRNSVGFDWDPITKELWFTNNGRDWLGDNIPLEQLNRASVAGLNFGFPYYYGKLRDPDYGYLHPVNDFRQPELEMPAHVAPLGMSFYTGKVFPENYQNQIFIAEHGSWNRSSKVGYRVTLVTLRNGKVMSYQPFVTGWLQGQIAWGRPVATLVMPDGSLLVSDDYAGVVYQIKYN